MRKYFYASIPFIFLLSIVLGPISSKAQSYCKPSFSGCSSGDSIWYFQVGSYSRSSGCSSGYDTTGVKSGSVVTLYRGKTYSLQVNSGNSSDQFAAWIDFNKNGSYED